ncbi:unnamed protein product [Choristocarpus tenellus]
MLCRPFNALGLVALIAPLLCFLVGTFAFNPLMVATPTCASQSISRSNFLKTATAGLLVGSFALTSGSNPSLASEELIETYWGNGCFWHVQHELAKAEKLILDRSDNELTAYAGYAGARNVPDGKLCYHNMRGVSDYGKLGAAEVVRLQIPTSKLPEFVQAYFKLFKRYDNGAGRVFLDRNDPQARPPPSLSLTQIQIYRGEYRSLLGVPGGLSGPLSEPIKAEAARMGLALESGAGNDPDTLLKNKVFVMDTKTFPFYKGELYHQFHNDMVERQEGHRYNDLREKYAAAGKISETGCPEGLM